MSFFDKIIKKIFPEESKDSDPILKENLKRDVQFSEGYTQWLLKNDKFEISGYIKKQFELAKENKENKLMFRALNQSHSRGFILRLPAGLVPQSMHFYFDYLKQVAHESGYHNYLSDVKYFEKKAGKQSNIEKVERHYLKPSIKNRKFIPGEPIDQIYGNILIENLIVNDHPLHIKLVAHSYNDKKYADALPFEKFIARL